MKKTSVFVALILGLVLLNPSLSQALIEIRGHYGVGQINLEQSGIPEIPTLPGYGLDVILDLPLMPVGLGVRYEMLGTSVSDEISGSDVDVELKMNRTSLVINKRLLDFVGFLGVIGTIGLSHQNTFEVQMGALELSAAPETSMSYTIGLEGGVNLLGMLVGAEVGYQNMRMKKTDDMDEDVDLNGNYFKVLVGIGF